MKALVLAMLIGVFGLSTSVFADEPAATESRLLRRQAKRNLPKRPRRKLLLLRRRAPKRRPRSIISMVTRRPKRPIRPRSNVASGCLTAA